MNFRFPNGLFVRALKFTMACRTRTGLPRILSSTSNLPPSLPNPCIFKYPITRRNHPCNVIMCFITMYYLCRYSTLHVPTWSKSNNACSTMLAPQCPRSLHPGRGVHKRARTPRRGELAQKFNRCCTYTCFNLWHPASVYPSVRFASYT